MKLALQEIEWGIEELETARGGASRQIVIGAMPFGGSVLLASVLDDFLRLHPQADVRISNGSAAEMARALSNGDVDFVLGLIPETACASVTNEPLGITPYSVVARVGHPLLKRGRVSLDDLIAYDWVIGTEGSSRRSCFEGLFAGRRGPQASIATCALPVIRNLLARSDRLTLMTSYELEHESNQLRAVDFGPIAPAPSIGISMRSNWLPTQLHTDLIEIMRAQLPPAKVSPLRRAAG